MLCHKLPLRIAQREAREDTVMLLWSCVICFRVVGVGTATASFAAYSFPPHLA